MHEIVAFASEHVATLTGLSIRQLRYWDRTGFFSPTIVADGRKKSAAFGRVYSFRDVVGLRTLALLRGKVPLQELRRVGEWLCKQHDTPWASLRFAVAGRKVLFFDPNSGTLTEAGSGQTHLTIELEPIAAEVKEASERLKKRRTDQFGNITRNRYVAHNEWVIAGTRIPTRAIWSFHEAGYDTQAILREYPTLTPDDIRAAIESEEKRRRA